MWLIPHDLKVLQRPPIHLPSLLPLYLQPRKLPRLPLQLHLQRLHMIKIHMRVTHCMRKRPRHEITYMRQHMRQ